MQPRATANSCPSFIYTAWFEGWVLLQLETSQIALEFANVVRCAANLTAHCRLAGFSAWKIIKKLLRQLSYDRRVPRLQR